MPNLKGLDTYAKFSHFWKIFYKSIKFLKILRCKYTKWNYLKIKLRFQIFFKIYLYN